MSRHGTLREATTITGIYVVVAVIPGLLMLGSLAIIRAYRLEEADLR